MAEPATLTANTRQGVLLETEFEGGIDGVGPAARIWESAVADTFEGAAEFRGTVEGNMDRLIETYQEI
jgi:hypothetical protein